jgi:hypothetical protein
MPFNQVGNNLLSQLSRLRVSPELGTAEVSRRKMDEAGRTLCKALSSSEMKHLYY